MWEEFKKRRWHNQYKLGVKVWAEELVKAEPSISFEKACELMRWARRRGQEMFKEQNEKPLTFRGQRV